MQNFARWTVVFSLLAFAAPHRSHAADSLPADRVIAHAEERFHSLQAYECHIAAASSQGLKSDAGLYHFWFKSPGLLRVHVEKGSNSGSDVVVNREGKITGRKGGLLKPFVIRLKSTDPRLRSVRGVSVQDLDWGSFYRKLRDHAALKGAKTVLAERRDARQPYNIVVTFRDGAKQMREEYRIDSQSWIMTEGDVFENGVRVDHVAFQDIHLNTGVGEGWFKL